MLLTVHSFLEVPRMQHLKMQAAMHVLYMRKERVHMGMGERERERDLREETVYCSPAWGCGKGSLV